MAAARSRIGIVIGTIAAVAGISIGVMQMNSAPKLQPAKEGLSPRIDERGPFAIVASTRAAKEYAAAIDIAQRLHSQAERVDFDPADLTGIEKSLRANQPRFALVFLLPDELDVNFAWRWLAITSQLDDDPFVDVRTGFITGATPDDAAKFMTRIAKAAGGKTNLPGAFVDNNGPPEQGNQQYFNVLPSAQMVPVVAQRFSVREIYHGKNGFTQDRLDSLDGCGLIHFGGHGHPDRIDDGLTAAQIPKLKLSPSIVFNGACYTGVTHRWFDNEMGRTAEKKVAADDSFCLRLLKKDVIAYLAAVHPDHGMPVYQEMEYLAVRGGPIGDTMKYTHDGVALGNGGKLPGFVILADKTPPPEWGPTDFMLHGTAARLLFGDPSLVVCDAFAPAPFKTEVKADGDALFVMATVTNADLKSTFTDTYRQDLNPKAPFNDRALIVVELPEGWNAVGKVEVVGVKAAGKDVLNRLISFAVEKDQNKRLLHVQVDVAATGFQQSDLRVNGATVELKVRR